MKKILIPVFMMLSIVVTSAQTIFEAVKNGNLDAVKNILSQDASLANSPDENGNCPVSLALSGANTELVRLLIQKGADVNLKNNYGFTPLHIAADKNQIEIGKILIEAGADLNAVSRYQTTPIFNAIEKGNIGFVELLIQKGADINFQSPIFGCPIHRAVYRDNTDILKLLIKNAANVEVVDPNGRTPLMLSGRCEEAEVLLNKNALINTVDQSGMNALHYAIRYGTDRSVKNNSFCLTGLLLQKGADANAVTIDGETPVSLAVEQGYTEVLKLLHKNNAKLNFVDKGFSRTLLHIAAIKGYGDIVEYLIETEKIKIKKTWKVKPRANMRLNTGMIKLQSRYPVIKR